MHSQRTIFIIDDSQEDRRVYRQFLKDNSQYNYKIIEFESATQALIYCQKKMPDLILANLILPDATGINFLEKLKRFGIVPVIILSALGDETIAVEAMKNGAQDYLVKGRLTAEALNRACNTVMERFGLMQQIEKQQEQQRLIGAIALRIRQFLKLEGVLNTAVDEIRNFLKADRVLVYQFNPDTSGTVLAESVLPSWKSLRNYRVNDTSFSDRGNYRQGYRLIIPNVREVALSEYHLQMLEEFQVQAYLIVPIVSCSCSELPENTNCCPTLDNPLWGLLIVHQCSTPRQWQQSEVDLLDQLSVQLAIAIQQAELYQNLQTLNNKLEAKVQALKETEMALREKNVLLQAIFNESTDAIFLVDGDTNQTTDCNCRAVELFEASSKDELLGIERETLQKFRFNEQERQEIAKALRVQSFWSGEIEYVTRKGNFFWGNLAFKQINVAGQEMSLIRVSDISDRKKSVEQIRRSLEEKETLLKEIHHRVKNNLQIISSLLRMQSRRSLDEATLILFQESQNRVQSMALIHEHLYQASDLSQIDFGEYIRSLTENLFRCYGISQGVITPKIETNALKLSLDTAIPCGLIINELVSNSLKYAFANQQQGEITIILRQNCYNTFRLIVGDSGIGIAENFDWQNTNSLGLRIVHNLTRQLKGKILLERDASRDRGTTFHINFPKTQKI